MMIGKACDLRTVQTPAAARKSDQASTALTGNMASVAGGGLRPSLNPTNNRGDTLAGYAVEL